MKKNGETFGEMGELKVGVGEKILAQCYQRWSKLYVCRRMLGEVGVMVGTRLPSVAPES